MKNLLMLFSSFLFFSLMFLACEKEEIVIDDFPYEELEGNIVFNRKNDNAGTGNPNTLDMFIMPANGSSTPINIGTGFYPKISPDGSKIAYISIMDCCNSGIYTMDIDGNNRELIQTRSGWHVNFGNTAPSWSPDSEKLAYYDSDNEKIYVLNVKYQEIDLVLERRVQGNIRWSPDGTQLGFLDFNPVTLQGDIYLVSLEEPTDPENISESLDHSSFFDWDWTWNENKIVASTYFGPMYIFTREGNSRKLVNEYAIYHPTWSKDGEYILYHQFDNFLDPNKDHRTVKVTDKEGNKKGTLIPGFNADW